MWASTRRIPLRETQVYGERIALLHALQGRWREVQFQVPHLRAEGEPSGLGIDVRDGAAHGMLPLMLHLCRRCGAQGKSANPKRDHEDTKDSVQCAALLSV